MPFRDSDGNKDIKGNVDAELVLHASALTYPKYDKAIIVSGDGDFYCLVEYLDAEGKLLCLLAPNQRYSKLLNKFSSKIIRVDVLKSQLELRQRPKKTGLGGRSKP